jgi:hypothetical protein
MQRVPSESNCWVSLLWLKTRWRGTKVHVWKMFLELKWKSICISQIQSCPAAIQTILGFFERVSGEKGGSSKTLERGYCGWWQPPFPRLGRLLDWYFHRYLEHRRQVSALLNHFLLDRIQRWRSKIWRFQSCRNPIRCDIYLSRLVFRALSAGRLHLHLQSERKSSRCHLWSPSCYHS